MGGVLYELRSSGSGLAYNDYDNNYSNSNVSSHLCEISYSTDPATWQKKSQSLDWLVMKVKTSFNKQSMKRIGNLYEKICSLENLQLADQKARKGKSWQYGVRIHDLNREDNILRLRQSLLTRAYKTSEEEVPLRAVLKCICGCKLTAGKSRGKNKLYWYYKCAKHTKKNYPAIRLHAQMDEILKILSLPDHYIAYMKEKINELINEQRGTQAQMLTDKKKELTGLQIRLDNLEEKYINNDLDVTAYKKWRDRYQAEISICQKYIMDMSQPMDEYQSFFNENIHRLGNLYYHYHNSDLHTQQALVKQVFNFQLYYHDGMYRTPYIMPIFAHNALILKEKRLLEIEQPFEKSTKVLECAPNQTPIEHLTPLSNLLNLLKRA